MKKSLSLNVRLLAFIFAIAGYILPHTLFAQAPPVDTLLNNRTYTIDLQEDMGKKNKTYPDELMFKGDKLKSKHLTIEEKFKSGKFTSSLDANSATRKVNFDATTKNESGEIITWVGTVTGEEIEGTAEWTKEDESTRMMYTFTGTLKVKKVPGGK